jgi:hypothetical protein
MERDKSPIGKLFSEVYLPRAGPASDSSVARWWFFAHLSTVKRGRSMTPTRALLERIYTEPENLKLAKARRETRRGPTPSR